VLAPGGRFNKESWGKQARVLAGAGFRVLAIDFRGRGQSRGGARTRDDGVRLDVLAAIRYLRKTGAKTVPVVGASFGGWAAAEASAEAEPGEIDRLILLAHSPVNRPQRMKGPIRACHLSLCCLHALPPRLLAMFGAVAARKNLLLRRTPTDGGAGVVFPASLKVHPA